MLQEKECKGIRTEKEETVLSFFASIIDYVEKLKEPIKGAYRNNEFSKVSGCKVNMQKSIIFLHKSNKQLVSENLKIILAIIAPPKWNMTGIDLTEQVYTLEFHSLCVLLCMSRNPSTRHRIAVPGPCSLPLTWTPWACQSSHLLSFVISLQLQEKPDTESVLREKLTNG